MDSGHHDNGFFLTSVNVKIHQITFLLNKKKEKVNQFNAILCNHILKAFYHGWNAYRCSKLSP